jgi:hypothetical protein
LRMSPYWRMQSAFFFRNYQRPLRRTSLMSRANREAIPPLAHL